MQDLGYVGQIARSRLRCVHGSREPDLRVCLEEIQDLGIECGTCPKQLCSECWKRWEDQNTCPYCRGPLDAHRGTQGSKYEPILPTGEEALPLGEELVTQDQVTGDDDGANDLASYFHCNLNPAGDYAGQIAFGDNRQCSYCTYPIATDGWMRSRPVAWCNSSLAFVLTAVAGA